MKRARLLFAIAVTLLSLPVMQIAADDTHTLTGEFYWDGGGHSGDLEAVFTPTGDGTWDVDFNFEFRGSPHTYSGTAKGSLAEGELEGTVLNENRKRTFTFSGMFEDGKFKGSHSETTGERAQSTGTLNLGA